MIRNSARRRGRSIVTDATKSIDTLGQGRKLNRTAPNASGRKPSRKTKAVQERILDEAARIFARKGYQLAKLTDIADAVGLHVTALRYHFLTKDDLVEDMMNSLVIHVHDHLQASVAHFDADASARSKIEAAAEAYMIATAKKREHMEAHANVLNQVPPDLRERHFKYLKANNDFWRNLVEEAVNAGELRSGLNASVATQVLMGSLIWTREWYDPAKSSPQEIAREILEILFNGIAPPPSG